MIDILVPYYGDPELARAAIWSVLHQSKSANRIVVVDDAYPDPWLEPWLAAQASTAPVTYVRNDPNLGARENYRRALRLAQSDYVVFMGADDLMHKDFVERAGSMLAAFGQPSVVQSGVRVIDGVGRDGRTLVDGVKRALRPRTKHPVELSGEPLAKSLLRGNWTYFPSLVWHRETIERLDFRPFHVVQDLGLLVDVVRSGGSMVYDPRVTFSYRRHAGSDSAVKTLQGERFAEERRYFTTVAADLRNQGWSRAARAAQLHSTSRAHASALCIAAASRRDWASAKSAVRHAVAR